MRIFKVIRFVLCLWLLLSAFSGKAVSATTSQINQQKIIPPTDSAGVVKLAKEAWKYIETEPAYSKRLYQELLQQGIKRNYPYWQGVAYMNMGMIQGNLGQDSAAIKSFQKAIPKFRNHKDKSFEVMCLLNIGACSERLGQNELCIKSTLQAIRLLEKYPDKPLLAHAYNCMGVLYFNQKKHTKGLDYFKKGVVVAREIQDTTKLIAGYFGLTNSLAEMKKFAEARPYSEKVMALAQASGNPQHLIPAHTCLSEFGIRTGNADKVIEHSLKLLELAKTHDQKHYENIAYINLAEGYAQKKDQANRLIYLNKALELSKQHGTAIQLDEVYKGLSEVYSHQKRYREALAFFQKYTVYKDSTNNLEDNKMIAELEIKYQTAKKEKALSEKQVQLLQQDLQLRKTRQFAAYGIAAAVLAFLVASFLFWQYRQKRKMHARQLKTMQQEKEIQVLHALIQGEESERSRISKGLHDGVAGMLAAVKMHLSSLTFTNRSLEVTDGYHQALTLLNEATDEVRKTAHNLMPEVLLHHGLDEALRRYCHNISSKNRLEIQYDSWGEIKRYASGFELSVYRIVQELLNNILKHSGATQALVQLSQQNNILNITVEDNGIGFSNSGTGTEGMGLVNLKLRVAAIKGKMEVETASGSGVSAYLEFDTAVLEKELV